MFNRLVQCSVVVSCVKCMSRRLGKVTLVVTAGRRSVTCYTGTFEHGPETSRSKRRGGGLPGLPGLLAMDARWTQKA